MALKNIEPDKNIQKTTISKDYETSKNHWIHWKLT